MTTPTDLETLTKQIRKEANGKVLIKEGETNGRPVLHVSKPELALSRTIATGYDWAVAPNALNAEHKHLEEEVA